MDEAQYRGGDPMCGGHGSCPQRACFLIVSIFTQKVNLVLVTGLPLGAASELVFLEGLVYMVSDSHQWGPGRTCHPPP